MRRVRFIAGVLGLVAAVASAETGPRLVCDDPVFRFGRVAPDAPDMRHTFVLRNSGDVTVHIADVGQECGCTDIVLSNRILPPGAESRLSVTFSVRGREGRVQKFLYVYSDDRRTPKLGLSFEGEVEPEVTFEPAGLLLGPVSRDAPVEKTVLVTFARGRDDEIRGAESTNPAFAATVETVEARKQYRVTVRTVPSQFGTKSYMRGAIRLQTVRRRPLPVEFSVSAMAMAEVLVAPDAILVPPSGTEPVTRYATLRPGRVKEFRIVSIEAPDPALKTSVRPAPGGGWQVRMDGLRPGRALEGKVLRIKTDLPGGGVFEIPFRADLAPGA